MCEVLCSDITFLEVLFIQSEAVQVRVCLCAWVYVGVCGCMCVYV